MVRRTPRCDVMFMLVCFSVFSFFPSSFPLPPPSSSSSVVQLYNNYMRSGEINIPRNKDENPFHIVPNGPMLIGTARLYLQPCFFLLPINESTAIIDYRGEHKGQLYVNLIPIPPRDEDTKDLKEEDLFFAEEELSELKGEPLSIRLEIKKCMGLPSKYAKNVYVQYKFFYDSIDSKTDPCPDTTINPMLNYERKVLVDIVEDEFVDHVKNGIMEFSVYGEQPVEKEDDDEDDGGKTASSSKGGKGNNKSSNKRGSARKGHKGSDEDDNGGLPSAQAIRLQKLEAVLREVCSSVLEGDDDPAMGNPDEVILKSPELIGKKVKELRVKEKALTEENFVLKSPAKIAAAGKRPQSAASTALAEENAQMKAELTKLRILAEGAASPNAKDGADGGGLLTDEAIAAENASLKAALASLQAQSSPSAVELAAAKEDQAKADQRARDTEEELAQWRKKYDDKAREAEAELNQLRQHEKELRDQLEAKLLASSSSKSSKNDQGDSAAEVAQLRAELASARGKIQSATPRTLAGGGGSTANDPALASAVIKKDAELEELRRKLKESEGKQGSSSCVIL